MAKRKKRPLASAQMVWKFHPDIPTHEFLEDYSLDEPADVQEAAENFIDWLEQGHFLSWEAVVCDEQGLPLSARQLEALDDLCSFNDDDPDNEEILYIDEIPRPSEPWHVILSRIVPHLVVEPFRTADVHLQVDCDVWGQLWEAIEEHGECLSLPKGVTSLQEIVPAELRHQLNLQLCFGALAGLGQMKGLDLDNEPDRVDDFLEELREEKESVRYLNLTLNSLLRKLVLPDRDRAFFVQRMQERLGLAGADEPLAAHL